MEETIFTKHPEGKQGVRILKRRYDLVKNAIIDALNEHDEISFKDLNVVVEDHLTGTLDGSIPWYVVTVKLDLEARGLLERVPGSVPQRLRAAAPEQIRPDKPPEGDSALMETMQILESYGTEQNRKVYTRHGAPEPLFGVSVANLRTVAKQTGKNQELATALWNTGNFDAMALATLIDDPESITTQELDRRVNDVSYYHLADFFSAFVAKTRYAIPKMKSWTASPEEFVRRCGYTLVSALAKNAALLDDATLSEYIEIIEAEIHNAPNRACEAMNRALIDIGRRRRLRDKAISAAKRIGPLFVDHGETNCKTPDAAAELEAMR